MWCGCCHVEYATKECLFQQKKKIITWWEMFEEWTVEINKNSFKSWCRLKPETLVFSLKIGAENRREHVLCAQCMAVLTCGGLELWALTSLQPYHTIFRFLVLRAWVWAASIAWGCCLPFWLYHALSNIRGPSRMDVFQYLVSIVSRIK